MIKVKEWILQSKEIRTEHLDLETDCVERGGNSTNHRGVLAQFLNTDFPKGIGIDLCHACHNSSCSNPKHMYWGTRKENVADARATGAHKSVWENTVNKYGYENACKMNALRLPPNGDVVKQVDTIDLKSIGASRTGSTPVFPTK
jgi:hypothetical protein